MAKLTKTAKGLSDQLGPVLEGVLDAIYRVTDAHKARQIKQQLATVIKLSILAAEAGMTNEQFMAMLTVVNTQQATVANGRIEFAAAVASGMETAEGKQFNVALSAGGSIAGFGIKAEGGYSSDERSSMYERSSQNMRIRLDFASLPMEKFDAMAEALATRVFAAGSEPQMPELSEDESSPILDALTQYLPVIREVFASNETPGPDED